MSFGWPTEAEWIARGVRLPQATAKIGDAINIPYVGRSEVIGFRPFPLCQYEVEIKEGELSGKRTVVSYEWADIAA